MRRSEYIVRVVRAQMYVARAAALLNPINAAGPILLAERLRKIAHGPIDETREVSLQTILQTLVNSDQETF
jgi:hypothetical protein